MEETLLQQSAIRIRFSLCMQVLIETAIDGGKKLKKNRTRNFKINQKDVFQPQIMNCLHYIQYNTDRNFLNKSDFRRIIFAIAGIVKQATS